MIAFASSLDQCGPLTRDVTDAALLLQAMQGRDPMDSTSVGIEGGVALPSREDLDGLVIGVARDFSHHAEGVEPGVAEVFERTLALIESLGGRIEEIELPHAEHGISAYYVIAPAEASANLARYDGVRYGVRADGDAELTAMYERTRSRWLRRRGEAADHARHLRALLRLLRRLLRARPAGADEDRRGLPRCVLEGRLVVTPTSPTVAFELGERTADPLAMYLSDYFTVPMSLAGIPAISIPAGLAAPPGGGGRAAGRLPDRRAGVRRDRAARRGARARAGDRVPRGPAMSFALSEPECREAAVEALDALPEWVQERLGNVAVIVEDSHPDGIMGIYDPSGGLQRIVIFRDANPNVEEVRRTVWHEVGHHLGMDEEKIAGLGYA